MEPIELRTHTRLWQVEKKLYKLYDYTLPMPLSVRMIGIFMLTMTVWGGICLLLHVHFGPPFGHIIWLAPPAAATYFGNKPVAEGKRLGELLSSQISYFAVQSRHYAALTPNTAPQTVYLRADVWRTHQAATPADTTGTDEATR